MLWPASARIVAKSRIGYSYLAWSQAIIPTFIFNSYGELTVVYHHASFFRP